MYCKQCGKQISDDSKFCSHCGCLVDEYSEIDSNEKRKTFYKGSVQRCPYCNEIVNDSDIICPSCKREFRGVGSSVAIQNLTNQLLRIDSETRNNGGTILEVAQKQEGCIRNYPIPDSKSDLIALMWHASSNIEFDILEHSFASEMNMSEAEFKSKKLLSEAWYDKEEAIYQRCAYLLRNDDSLQDIENKHSEITGKYSTALERAQESWERYSKIRKKDIQRQWKLDKKQIEIDKKREEKELEQIRLEREWQQIQREKQSKNRPVQVTNNYYYTETAVSGPYTPAISSKSRSAALFLCIFLGFLGAHQFYAGKTGKGILYLFTIGLIGIGWIIDIFIILAGSLQDGNGLYIKKW